MHRYKILLAYDGTGFKGWQIQEKENAPLTIQETVEKALFKVAGTKIRIYGAGRTDAGVHAHGQAAHFDLPESKDAARLQKSLNAILPDSIQVLDVEHVPPLFHARNNAVAKTYIYDLWPDWRFIPPGIRFFVWQCGPLNIERMNEILPFFKGKHDFAALQNKGTPIKTTVRHVYEIKLYLMSPVLYYPAVSSVLRISITCNGFLKQMARNMAGALVWAGKGKLLPVQLANALEKKDRRFLSSPTAPAHGLSLAKIWYHFPPTINA